MKRLEGKFSHQNGQSLSYQFWLPENKAKAAIYIVHGLHEHGGRYQHLAAYLTKNDYAVYTMDFLGHGKSAGVRSYVDTYDDFISSMDGYLDLIRSWQPDLPIYIIGHSMGGLLSAVFLTVTGHPINGAILSGSLVQVPDYVSEITIKVGKKLADLLPKVRLVNIDIEALSRDPSVVQAYREDPLVFNGKTTARISNELNNAINWVEKKGSSIKQPMLLLHGGGDRICDPSWSQYLYDLITSPDKQLIIYDDLYHEIYNEPESAKVFADVLNWLENRVQQ
jgi:alpha-beta hydrolase superfamily lysophospholipase